MNATPLSSTPLNDQQFVLNKNNEIKYYFVTEIKERESMSKRLSNYIAFSDNFDKSIPSFVTVIRVPVEIASSSFSLAFLILTGIVTILLKTTWNRKKDHNKIVILVGSKLSSIETKISQALINNEIGHENFVIIINEEINIED